MIRKEISDGEKLTLMKIAHDYATSPVAGGCDPVQHYKKLVRAFTSDVEDVPAETVAAVPLRRKARKASGKYGMEGTY